MVSSTHFHKLPYELILHIFDAASQDEDTSVALTLARVASWTHSIVDSRIYDTVVLPTPKAVIAFHQTVLARPPQFFARHVRRLWLASTDGNDEIIRCVDTQKLASILAVCTEVVDLTIDQSYTYSMGGLDLPCRPNSLLMVTSALVFLSLPSPILDSVTHLYLLNGQLHLNAVQEIAKLPYLTHLAVSYPLEAGSTHILKVAIQLLRCDKLQRLLILPWQMSPVQPLRRGLERVDVANDLAKLNDPRIIVISEVIGPEEQFEVWRDCGVDVDRLWRRYDKEYSRGSCYLFSTVLSPVCLISDVSDLSDLIFYFAQFNHPLPV
ncbi:hypothetical protein BU17DRAFT_49811 [Hysterangium stoloniferum]|nr:hypothetical protein BU17DRAFT_49811 [Hysterangium stoloniferum]